MPADQAAAFSCAAEPVPRSGLSADTEARAAEFGSASRKTFFHAEPSWRGKEPVT
jgi:hypothetical protein